MGFAPRLLTGAGLTTALAAAGAGAALAATSGSIEVSTDGAHVTKGTYNFKSAGCKWGGNAWDGYVAGTFSVDTPTDHLNGKVDGYGWTKLVQADSKRDYAFSTCLSGRDVLLHDSIALQACREHWWSDECHVTTVRR